MRVILTVIKCQVLKPEFRVNLKDRILRLYV